MTKRRLIVSLAALLLVAALVVGGLLIALYRQLPPIYSLADYRPPQASKVYSADGELIGTFALERRTRVDILALPPHVRFAFLAAEDSDFYRHEGIDWWGVARALAKNLRPGAHLQGASTITQQTVKTLIVGPERSLWRKVREAILARRLEQLLDKDAILNLYLNQIYFGHGAYGIEEAALTAFGKSAAALNVAEAAVLAAAPKHPARYALDADRPALWQRRRYVLLQMAAHGWLSREQAILAADGPLPALARPNAWPGFCRDYVETIRRQLSAELGDETLLTGGLRIEVGLHARAQRAASLALGQSIEDVARRRGSPPAPRLQLPADRLADMLAAAKLHFSSKPAAEGCLGCVEPPWLWHWRDVAAPEPDWQASVRSLARGLVGRAARPFARFRWPVVALDAGGRALLETGAGPVVLGERGTAWLRPNTRHGRAPKGPPYRPGDVLEVELARGERIPADELVPGTGGGRGLYARLVPRAALQGALVAIDPTTRAVRALLGAAPQSGDGTGFNRATQARRQPGSAFKPILYAAGLATRAITPATLCNDAPIELEDPSTHRVWRPENYEDGRYDGAITYREALARSKNTCSIRLLERVGFAEVQALADTMGLGAELPRNLPLALGTGEVTVLGLTNAMATLAAAGQSAPPRFIERIFGLDGQLLPQPRAKGPEQALSPATAFVLTNMLMGAIEHGTGRRATLLDRPLAGKTGTSQLARDVWFVGYAPTLAASVWLGYDDNASLGQETGASAALPAWIRFMGATVGLEPRAAFVEPAGVVHEWVDAQSGEPSEGQGTIDEVFVAGTEPIASGEGLPSMYLQDPGGQSNF